MMRRVIYHELVANATGAVLFPCSSRPTSFLSAFSMASACCAGWPAPESASTVLVSCSASPGSSFSE